MKIFCNKLPPDAFDETFEMLKMISSSIGIEGNKISYFNMLLFW